MNGVHECDLSIIRASNYAVEVEIKVTVADLKNDLKKKHTHSSIKIKEFYYAIPDYILENSLEYIPKHAGILTCSRLRGRIVVKLHRKAVVNTKSRKLTDKEVLKTAKLGCMRIFKLKQKIVELNEKKR